MVLLKQETLDSTGSLIIRDGEQHRQQRHQSCCNGAKMTLLEKYPAYGYGYGPLTTAAASSSQQERWCQRNAGPSSSYALTPQNWQTEGEPPDDDHGAAPRKKLLVDNIRERDFPHLLQRERQQGDGGLVYLDHAGATLYGASQLRDVTESLLKTVHGNPHSQVSMQH